MPKFYATREIGIDAGHRVTNHHSKCFNLHGHRYTIQATITGELRDEGSQEGMVMDFGFLKDAMMNAIDGPCDHSLILWIKDPLVAAFLDSPQREKALEVLAARPWAEMHSLVCGKLYLMRVVPTAENLAKHWYFRLGNDVAAATLDQVSVASVKVWETPNCSAEYKASV